MRVIFRDRNDVDHVICLTKSVQKGLQMIGRFAKERGYKIYYTRIWPTEDDKQLWEDFGSHTEFGILEMENGESAQQKFAELLRDSSERKETNE